MKTKILTDDMTHTLEAASKGGAAGQPLPFPAFTAREVSALANMSFGESSLEEILLRSLLKARVFGEAGHEDSRLCHGTNMAGIAEQFMNFVSALASSIDAKDPYTHGHSKRVTMYSLAIANALGLDDEEKEDLELAGYLHDIGKIGMPQDILQKPMTLSDDEFEVVKRHPANGVKILENLKNLKNVSKFILHHHERMDGTGYPSGLAGEDIPLGSRILAVADAFDAITSNRPYRKASRTKEALLEIEINAGRQFDPVVVGVFVSLVRLGRIRVGEHHRRLALHEPT